MGMQAKQAGGALRLDANRGRNWSMKSRPALKTSEPSCSLVVRIAYFREQRALGAPKILTISSFLSRIFHIFSSDHLPFSAFAFSSSLEPHLLVPVRSNISLHRLCPRLSIFIQYYASEYFQLIRSKKCGLCLEHKATAWRTETVAMSRRFATLRDHILSNLTEGQKSLQFESRSCYQLSCLRCLVSIPSVSTDEWRYTYSNVPLLASSGHVPRITHYHFLVMFSSMYSLHLKEWNIKIFRRWDV
jgi:hypothetical protein